MKNFLLAIFLFILMSVNLLTAQNQIITNNIYSSVSKTFSVKENSEKENSKFIELLYIQVNSSCKKNENPIFILLDGPGKSNIDTSKIKKWMLENHDVILLGYRGIDGNVNLNIPNFKNVLKTSKPLEPENIMNFGEILKKELDSIEYLGIDLEAYNIVEIANDIENLRIKLGYEKINLYSEGFGTLIAYTYGLKYKKNVDKIIMLNALIPENIGIWDADYISSKLVLYNVIWQKDSICTKKSVDIIETMKDVLKTLPAKYNDKVLDKDKIRIATFFLLNDKTTAIETINAYVNAENGNYSGLFEISQKYSEIIENINWGDFILKTTTAKDYSYSEFVCDGSIIGSPFMNIFWGSIAFSNKNINKIDNYYTQIQDFDIPVLFISGNLDISNPFEFIKDDFFPKTENSKFLIIKEMGHSDIFNFEDENFDKLLSNFMLDKKQNKKYTFYQSVNFIEKE